MQLAFSDEDLGFRDEVRAFLRQNLPDELRDRSMRGLHPRRDDMIRWQKVLAQKGWLVPSWPVEHGGTGWSAARRYLFNKEYFLSGAPQVTAFGVSMVGPVIYTFGSDEQKQRHLPGILSSDIWWCQGYSEPGAGSDLASLRTRAVRKGDVYVVNGQKIWTSYAHYADMMFALVRTDPDVKKQEGISFLLIDMKTPGITVRPIVGLDLEHSLNEVFFDDVEVPAANLIGEENKGWTYAKFLLGHERNTVARVARSQFQLQRLKEIAAAEGLADDPDFTRRIAGVEVDLLALEAMELRYLSQEVAGKKLLAEPSILKIKGAEIAQGIKALAVRALGPDAMAYAPESERAARNDPAPGGDLAHGPMADHLYQRAATIYGGTNEIQREIIAKTLLR
ncbi:MAG: acyl-CoA dehydrogenase family protein [Paracoccaceae bacterium]